jgi:pimeloyl-ACP methyl ester carboxylesterase
VGDGPSLVKAANYLTHLEHDWENPIWRHWIAGLSRHRKLIRYDERGCGLSDRNIQDFTLDAWLQDLEAVVDDAGLERFPLLGLSQGGAVAIAYCVRHPERVSHLILYGAFARGHPVRPDSEFERETKLIEDVLRLGWGKDSPAFREVFTSLYMPDASSEQLHSFYELQRLSTSAENAVRFERAFHEVDVSDLLDKVDTPTLVMHARGDARVPFGAGRALATRIKGAGFVSLDGANHILLEGEPAWDAFVDEIDEFLGD